MGTSAYDGFFEITLENDGIYININEAKSGGKNVETHMIETELAKMNVTEYDLLPMNEMMVEGFNSIKIKVSDRTDLPEEVEVGLTIEVSQDKMSAYATLYHTETEFRKGSIIEMLEEKGISTGIESDLLDALEVEREYNIPYLVARGKEVVEGTPATIKYLFKTEKDIRPLIDEEGNVNYHQLNIIANVKEGQLIAKIIQSTEGENGLDLLDNVIVPKKLKSIRHKYGKNIKISDDKMELFAAKNGLVKLSEGRVIVNDVYDVPNNVGNSTGDIEFEGTVVVHGNVITGFKVKAKGDIEVMGVVEGAEVIAGGNIILHKGIQGMGKSHIEARGSIKAKYIENANVISGGDVHSEAILHSTVSCKGTITVEGKKGMISGGLVRAGEGVVTKILGSHMGTITTVEVGIDPEMIVEYTTLKKDIPRMENEAMKLEQVVQLLNKRKEMVGKLEDSKQEMYMSAVRNKIFLSNKLVHAKKKYEALEHDVDNKNSGSVKVSNELYTGVKISIGSTCTYVREEYKYIKFIKSGADVKMVSL